MNMRKLDVSGNVYSVNSRRRFCPISVEKAMIQQVVDFAYEMCFGAGHHRDHRTGGMLQRKAGELFCNTFQGKLAEVCLRKYLIDNAISCPKPDFNIYGEGLWDDADLTAGGKSISVKSAAYFSNLLLLESHDYDSQGNYLPNLDSGDTSCYDIIVLIRISPDIKSIFRNNRLLFCNSIDKSLIESLVYAHVWSFDIAGWISHSDFCDVIADGDIIPRGALLNGKTPMDADNYYVQAGDLRAISSLLALLRAT